MYGWGWWNLGSRWRVEAWLDVRRGFGFVLLRTLEQSLDLVAVVDDGCGKITFKIMCCIEEI